jgi:hypothetical protein
MWNGEAVKTSGRASQPACHTCGASASLEQWAANGNVAAIAFSGVGQYDAFLAGAFPPIHGGTCFSTPSTMSHAVDRSTEKLI